jgi:hypothetical protein
VSSELRRVVFAVHVPPELQYQDNVLGKDCAYFKEAIEIFRISQIDYTIIKFGDLNYSEPANEIPFRLLNADTNLQHVSKFPAVAADLQKVGAFIMVSCR